MSFPVNPWLLNAREWDMLKTHFPEGITEDGSRRAFCGHPVILYPAPFPFDWPEIKRVVEEATRRLLLLMEGGET